MTGLSNEAIRQIEQLARHYAVEVERPEALANLQSVVQQTIERITSNSPGGLSHPRPYPSIARLGLRWIMIPPYWISWMLDGPTPVITNVFHASADIPGRIRR